MKRVHLLYVVTLLAMFAGGCSRDDAHKSELGLALTLETTHPADEVSQVKLWLFTSADNTLRYEFDFESAAAIALKPIELTPGSYKAVVVTNLSEAFRHNAVVGTTVTNELFVRLNDPSSSPAHAHYGSADFTLSSDDITPVKLTLSRVFVENQLTLTNLPTEVTHIAVEVLNASEGFYPALSTLSPVTARVSLGDMPSSGGKATFPLKRFMPTVAMVTRADDGIMTHVRFTFTYSDGNKIEFDVQMPQMNNGGSYQPEIPYAEFRPGTKIVITDINGWQELPPITGEILNPTN